MSIADKLLYLNDTKTALADAINIALSARGETLLDANATFRSYAERLFYPGYLFGQGEQGGYYLPPNATSYFTDTAGTTPAELTDAIALVQGEVGPDWAQGTATARPVWAREPEGGRRNLVVTSSEIGSPGPARGATTVSTGWTLFDNALLQGRRIPPSDGVTMNYSYYQTTPPPVGTYRFSIYVRNEDGSPIVFGNPTVENSNLNPFAMVAWGHSVVPNQLTIEELPGGIYRLSRTITVSGNVVRGWGILRRTTHNLSAPAVIVSGWQIESGSVTTPYQLVNGASDITEPGVPDVPYVRFDLVDDVLTTTLPAATYTVVLPTRQGIWIDSVAHAGGTFSIGPTSYTGGPAGILTALESDGVCKMVAPPLVIDRALSAGERNALVRWYQARGAGELLEVLP